MWNVKFTNRLIRMLHKPEESILEQIKRWPTTIKFRSNNKDGTKPRKYYIILVGTYICFKISSIEFTHVINF